MTAYLRPHTLEEALAARAQNPAFTVLAGGTDLMVNAPHKPEPAGLLDVFGLPGLCGIESSAHELRIGAATPYRAILEDARVRRTLPCLWEACREVGAVQIQARGTLGGNLVTSSPVGDTLPALLALDAVIELASVRGARKVPYAQFCTGYRKTVLAADELVVAVLLPLPVPGTRQLWRKVGTRRAQAIAKVALAAVARVEDGLVVAPRIALGAVAATPIRARAAEVVLAGVRPDAACAGRVAGALLAEIHPIPDVRSTEAYRREVAGRLVARFVLSLGQEKP